MNCSEVQELLSAYYDGELSADVTGRINEHLPGCERCAEELAAFKNLSNLANGLHPPAVPSCMWEELENKLDAPAASPWRQVSWMRKPEAILAIAAGLLVAVGLIGPGLHGLHSVNHDAQFAAVFGQYLETFQKSPADAQQILQAKYEGRAVDVRDAVRYVGYTPAVASGLPPGYSLDRVYVWKMPCCTCVQSLCQRDDGTTVAVFEHDNAQLDWYGCRSATTKDCDGQRCTLAQLDNQVAATWKVGKRHITVIGARDAGEVGQLAASFAGTSAKDSAER